MFYLAGNVRKRLKQKTIPKHIAIIMDGNGRWAKRRGMPRTFGHTRGMESLRKIVEECAQIGVKYLSAYAFSTENWKRPKVEVDFLMDLFKKSLESDSLKLKENRVAIKFIGDLSPFRADLQKMMKKTERQLLPKQATAQLNLMVNYGSRKEILDGINKAIAVGKKLPSEKSFEKYLYTAGIPDPELLIRTSGELRLSNYLLWQLSYSEFYFAKCHWPAFGVKEFHKAIEEFQKRDRRKGGV